MKLNRVATIAGFTMLSVACATRAAAQEIAVLAAPRVVIEPASLVRVEAPPAKRP
ncbi:MAG TPA: hypothetical protein VM115_07135 [Vicinamibacterales bacterium]|nr:hypothetical protein [Vicinamibacterales bacterium]